MHDKTHKIELYSNIGFGSNYGYWSGCWARDPICECESLLMFFEDNWFPPKYIVIRKFDYNEEGK